MTQNVLGQMKQVQSEVYRIGEMMDEISAASEQQSVGIQQINQAVDQVNQVTQQNASNSEESASAAEQLSGQAEEMSSLVSNFQLTRAAELRMVPTKPESASPSKAIRSKHQARSIPPEERHTSRHGAAQEIAIPLDERELALMDQDGQAA